MSDDPDPEYSDRNAYIEQAKLRDTRFAILGRAIAVENDLRDSPVIKALMEAIRADGDQAMEELAQVSPSDANALSGLLVKVRTLVYVRSTLNTILRAGVAAENDIRAEDERERV